MNIDLILEKIRGKRILVVGDVMLDRYIWGDATRLSPEAPVPVVRVDRETSVAGGAANVAINLASLGADVSLFGWVGEDEAGANLRAILSEKGVKLIEGAVDAARPTIVKTRVLCRRQQLCRLDHEADPATYALSASEIDSYISPVCAGMDAVLLSDYGKGLLTPDSIAKLRTIPGIPDIVALDPKPRPGVDYAGLTLMTPNRSEAAHLAGIEDTNGEFPAEEVCRRLHALFAPRYLVVTLGPDGMLVSKDGKPLERIPTFAHEVFDVSGAGDTVIAALTLAMAAGFPIGDAARFANTAAGVVVGKLGTATASPEEIRSYACSIPGQKNA